MSPVQPDTRISVGGLNRLDRREALDLLGGLFEDSPSIVARALEGGPFASRDALYRALCDSVDRLDRERKIALIRAHPDLVGRAGLAGTLSRDSTAEQRAAGLSADALAAGEVARFQEANAAYQERFGFPFVICARENRKESILRGFAERLGHDRETEIATAIREIRRIAWYRLDALVSDDAGDDGESGQR
ncbi:MAG TPA: 2-oxo-4-hydroxy-4-carboxy-5-ureidoimidazoline decarboxylase [Thermomicrobiales bacterium]|nr:2-oxo-4-hydroxy-4-carboxy-5-ureidoimidazoline decarboxylase [Thermomicrobiales bacterium]